MREGKANHQYGEDNASEETRGEEGELMKCCRECKALNPQVALICVYCSETLPTVIPVGRDWLYKYNLSRLTKPRLIYLGVAILIILIAGLIRC